MGSSYYRWGLDSDLPLFLQLVESNGSGATGKSPEVAIRRHRNTDGTALDNNYYNGAGGFTATPTWLALSEFDVTNNPGLYLYQFVQSAIAVDTIYLVYFRNTSAPIGFTVEEHVCSNEISIPSSSPAVPVIPGDTVMGRLADMENSTSPVALANADAVWDETLADHLLSGSTGEALALVTASFVGARQIDMQVEDTGSIVIQGAQVDLYDQANTTYLGVRKYSDINGKLSIALDDGNFNLRVFASGYSFTTPIPLTVTADVLEPNPFVIQGTPGFSITPPSAPDLCVIYGTLRNAAGVAIAGACVQVYAITPQVVSGVQKGTSIAKTTTNVNGYFEIELVRTAEVNVEIVDADIDVERTVPDAASQDFTTWT